MNALHRMERFLDEHVIPFEIVMHPHTQTSVETARVTKGVLLDSMDCQTHWPTRPASAACSPSANPAWCRACRMPGGWKWCGTTR